MVAVTYGVARVTAAESASTAPKTARAETAAPRKSWFGHFIDVLVEARMMQAQREIRMYTDLLPYTLDERGNRLIKTNSGDIPFDN